VRLPDTKVGADGEVFTLPGGAGTTLTLQHRVVPLTFALIDEYVLADPTAEEEELCQGSVTVSYNDKEELCSLFKPGGVTVSEQVLRECMSLAKKRVKDVLLVWR